MSGLIDHLQDLIKAEGPITIERYMQEALTHPAFGYYMSGDPFGVEGDFTTAPEVSQIFGEMLGLWCAVAWQAMGSPKTINLVELGPGRGTLMDDVMRTARIMPDFEDALRVHFVEVSPALREMQKNAMMGHGLMPAWRDSLFDVDEGPTLLLANEFFDALPVRQFVRQKGNWFERRVGLDGNNLRYVIDDVAAADVPLPAGLVDTPEGAIFETCPQGRAIVGEIAKRVVAHGGAALMIDYGHQQAGLGETLQAVKKHMFHDPLVTPGEADLTAHVDFQALGDVAREMGAEVFGPVPQGAFLERLGLGERANALFESASPEQQAEIKSAYHRLTDGEEMGLLFKVMAVVQPGLAVPPWGG